jgi:hypothetical protein
MTLTRVLHQQFMQLRWHLLACLGVIMVLPVEETIVNLRDPQGHYQSGIATGVLAIAPLLAALIACANVQADLDDKRDLFWRSKPVRVGAFITTKFLVGLLLALAVLCVPVMFIWVMARVMDGSLPFDGYYIYTGNILLISILTYSLSFLCNVLVRKTARAWLIGMALTCFVLLLPFMLSLRFTDVATDIQNTITKTYLLLTLGAALLGFVLANLAAGRNWHIQANLKRLLWAGAGLVFAIVFMGARQVANIEVLDEEPAILGPDVTVPGMGSVYRIGDQVIACGFKVDGSDLTPGQIAIRSVDDRIVREAVPEHLADMARPPLRTLLQLHGGLQDPNSGTGTRVHPRSGAWGWQAGLPLRIGEQTYLLALFVDYREEKIIKDSGATDKTRKHEKVTLRCFKSRPFFTRRDPDQHMQATADLDLSEYLNNPQRPRIAMRAFGDVLIVAINNRVIEIGVTGQGELQNRSDSRFNYLVQAHMDRSFKIPLVPMESLDIRDRIQLSIDLVFWPGGEFRYHGLDFDSFSWVDAQGDAFRFVSLDRQGIHCFDVIEWNQEEIFCERHSYRPFTWLEEFRRHEPHFVKHGRLYAYSWDRLMVFDLRSARGVRKLGHFQRLQRDFRISDVLPEENGNILLFRERWHFIESDIEKNSEYFKDIYLLKAPRS